ncbi:hypothetical protein TURU_036502 [Turdus rufiventris]|nr:hypothetical protein TURU_036502 [Turdus rufiventris]
MHKREPEGKGEESVDDKREESPRPNQGARPRTLPFKERNSPKGRRRRGGRERGRSPSKSQRWLETPHHSTSSSESDEDYGSSRYPEHYCSQPRWDTKRGDTKRYPSTSDSDSNIEKIPEAFAKLTGLSAFHVVNKGSQKPMPLTDWKEIQMACADIAPSAALAFPVRQINNDLPAYSPVSPKDMQAVVKAIAEKGINSVMVSTFIDGIFGNDDMLPFDIKQTCRMIFDGAGMIVFKQEWEDNCLNMLGRVTGDHHPLRNSSLQQLMGNDPSMVSPQTPTQGLRASEVAAITCAATETIRMACTIVSKPASWTTIRQSESESFIKFVDRLQAAIDASDLPAEAKGPVVASCL